MSAIYVLKESDPKPHWGNYSDLLRHGISMHRERVDGVIQLEWTGPYIPAVTFPASNPIVTDELRQKLSALVPTLKFRNVIKAHISELNWHE